MPQMSLPFHYDQERSAGGITALSGLASYMDLAWTAGLVESVDRRLGVSESVQGWTNVQMVMSLLLLNLAGGESVEDLRVLEADEGLGRLLRRSETHGVRRVDRQLQSRRWRKGRDRNVPSPSAVFRYLSRFHDESEEDRRQRHTAFIPRSNEALEGPWGGQRRPGGLYQQPDRR